MSRDLNLRVAERQHSQRENKAGMIVPGEILSTSLQLNPSLELTSQATGSLSRVKAYNASSRSDTQLSEVPGVSRDGQTDAERHSLEPVGRNSRSWSVSAKGGRG